MWSSTLRILAVGVVPLERRHPDHDVGLLGGPVKDHEPLRRGGRSHALRPRPTEEDIAADLVSRLVEAAYHALHDGAVLDPAGRGYHDVGSAVMLAMERGDLVARCGANGFLEPQDVAPEGMTRVHGRIEQVVHFLGRFVAVHQYFLDDHLPFGFQLVLAQRRAPDDLRQDIQAEVGRFGQEPHVERRVLLGRERVQVAPHRVDKLGDLTCAAFSGPLEEQVLQEM